jgi:aspartyl-tRNA(Asn)/glutamyl-tRNA(Gln) amidotransferase subunit A
LDACLARIAALNGRLHAVHHLDEAGARSAHGTGPLSGIPRGIKDDFDVAGLPCTANSRLHAGRIAQADAPIVTMLRATGAPLIGKLATWEYGKGTGAEHFDLPNPPARNPWD